MEFLIIIILGVVQGATEFLPVSSSGHLVLLYNIFKVEGNTILLSVILHVATLLAVLLVYRKMLWQLIKKPFCKTNQRLVMATVPTVIIVSLFKGFIEKSFNGQWLFIGFLITAVLLVVAEELAHKPKGIGVEQQQDPSLPVQITAKQSVIIGITQGIAAVPGISRSGSTIAAGLLSGAEKEDAANFSFLLSIPIILASLAYELWGLFSTNEPIMFNGWHLTVGFVCSFVTGFLCIKLMLKLIKKQKLFWFSIYLCALASFLVLNNLWLNWF